MSGASIAAGKLLSCGGSVVIAEGTFWARAPIANVNKHAVTSAKTAQSFFRIATFCAIPPLLYSGRMQTFLRTIEFLTLGLWLGGNAFLSFVVAPGAFSILGSRDAAGLMVGYSLARLHFAGIILGLLFLIARLLRTRDFAAFTSSAALCVVLMVILTAASQFTVSNRMERLKKQMVSVQNTPENDPRRLEFNRLHHVSVAYEGAVLVLGLAGMFLLVKEVARL
jgi:uncharacterized membrane protein